MDFESVSGRILIPSERMELALRVELLRHRFGQARAGAVAAQRAQADAETIREVVRAVVVAGVELELEIKRFSELVGASGSGPGSLDWEIHEWIGCPREQYDLAVVKLLLGDSQVEASDC